MTEREPLIRRSATKREKYLERIHLLRTLANYGPLHASDLADRANSECDHDVFDDLPDISRRGIGQKLQAMEDQGLVAGSFLGVGLPKQWEIVDGGRKALALFEQEEGSLGDEKTYTMDEWASAWRRRCELLEEALREIVAASEHHSLTVRSMPYMAQIARNALEAIRD